MSLNQLYFDESREVADEAFARVFGETEPADDPHRDVKRTIIAHLADISIRNKEPAQRTDLREFHARVDEEDPDLWHEEIRPVLADEDNVSLILEAARTARELQLGREPRG